MKQIDLDALNFKLNQPSIKCKTLNDLDYFQQTQVSNLTDEEYTPNPFRHSHHLWKNYETNHQIQQHNQCHLQTLTVEQKEIILENFDSFQDGNFIVDRKNNVEEFQENFKLKPLHQQHIKVEQSSFSLIEDDYNAEVALSSFLERNKSTRKTQKDQIFFLTTQQQQSTIKEFYFNLNSSNQDLGPLSHKVEEEPQKNEIKKLIYAFIDQLQGIRENDINPQFINDLKLIFNQGLQEKDTNKMSKSRGKSQTTRRSNGKENQCKKMKKKRWI